MPKPTTHRHHYVPESFQKRFLTPGKATLHILDINPPVYHGGKTGRALWERGPAAWFWEKDLYTTRFFGQPDDTIETMLFGRIDREGVEAIGAMVVNDSKVLTRRFNRFFEYLDALRLRTPKGLKWLREAYGSDPDELLIVMQDVRAKHITMWLEGVHEILSARESAQKFVFSDHPVSLFNRSVDPLDPNLLFPHDPHPASEGTQTLFPLDRDHLMVITHRDFAIADGRTDPLVHRRNARFGDNTVVRTDKVIRKRSLNAQQVAEVNYILKTKAYRYIAAGDKASLFPERQFQVPPWLKLGGFLLPPNEGLSLHPGYIIMGRPDGTIYSQNGYGERPKTQEEYEAVKRLVARQNETLKRALKEAGEKHRAAQAANAETVSPPDQTE